MRHALAGRAGSIVLAALIAHVAWHWMTERWVLGDWYTNGSYLHCSKEGCRSVMLSSPER